MLLFGLIRRRRAHGRDGRGARRARTRSPAPPICRPRVAARTRRSTDVAEPRRCRHALRVEGPAPSVDDALRARCARELGAHRRGRRAARHALAACSGARSRDVAPLLPDLGGAARSGASRCRRLPAPRRAARGDAGAASAHRLYRLGRRAVWLALAARARRCRRSRRARRGASVAGGHATLIARRADARAPLSRCSSRRRRRSRRSRARVKDAFDPARHPQPRPHGRGRLAMQTASPPRSSPTRTSPTPNEILRTCVHCGFCTATCPTYRAARRRARQPARAHLPDQGHAGERRAGRRRDGQAHRPLPVAASPA